MVELRPAAAPPWPGPGRALPGPAAALVRAALPRRGPGHSARPRPAPGIRCVALGAAGGIAGARGRLQAADLRDPGPGLRALRGAWLSRPSQAAARRAPPASAGRDEIGRAS